MSKKYKLAKLVQYVILEDGKPYGEPFVDKRAAKSAWKKLVHPKKFEKKEETKKKEK